MLVLVLVLMSVSVSVLALVLVLVSVLVVLMSVPVFGPVLLVWGQLSWLLSSPLLQCWSDEPTTNEAKEIMPHLTARLSWFKMKGRASPSPVRA